MTQVNNIDADYLKNEEFVTFQIYFTSFLQNATYNLEMAL